MIQSDTHGGSSATAAPVSHGVDPLSVSPVQRGWRHLSAGELDAAAAAVAPLAQHAGDPDLLNLLGAIAVARGDARRGRRHFIAAIRIDPQRAASYSNLGNAYLHEAKYKSAAAAYHRALVLDPCHDDARHNLALAMRMLGRHDEALRRLEDVVARRPDFAQAVNSMGVTLVSLGRSREAVACFRRVITLDPRHREGHRNLAVTLERLGEPEQALEAYRTLLKNDPTDARATHKVNSLEGNIVPEAPEAYVADLFNDYAPRFERHLVKELGYRVPWMISRAIRSTPGLLPSPWRVLDLGCGTGLCGAELRDVAGHLVGVDIAERMLGVARERDIYDELVTCELRRFLRARQEHWNLIVAADVLIYLGELSELMRLVSRRLEPDGVFVFTTESVEGDGYTLQRNGRFAHSGAYVRGMVSDSGMATKRLMPITVRSEAGRPAAGHLYIVQTLWSPAADA